MTYEELKQALIAPEYQRYLPADAVTAESSRWIDPRKELKELKKHVVSGRLRTIYGDKAVEKERNLKIASLASKLAPIALGGVLGAAVAGSLTDGDPVSTVVGLGLGGFGAHKLSNKLVDIYNSNRDKRRISGTEIKRRLDELSLGDYLQPFTVAKLQEDIVQ